MESLAISEAFSPLNKVYIGFRINLQRCIFFPVLAIFVEKYLFTFSPFLNARCEF